MTTDHPISSEEWEKIEQYLLNNLPVGEREIFANSIQSDEILRQKVAIVRGTLTGINEAIVRSKLNDYHMSIESGSHQKSTHRWSPFRIHWGIAASLLFVFGLATFWFFQTENSMERTYSRYYKPDPGLMTLMGAEASNYTFEKAMVEYKNGEYEKALKAWLLLLKDQSENDTLLYFTAAAAQASEDYGLAIRLLKTVAHDSSSLFQNDARWYLGLAYLKSGKKQEAVPYLQSSGREASAELIGILKP